MHHKRKRPKNRRAGCLLCKPHKANHVKGTAHALRVQQRRIVEAEAFQRREEGMG